MVKKLLKYEIKYYLKTLIFILPIAILLSLSNIMLTPLRNVKSPIAALYYLNVVLLIAAIMICLIAPIVLSVVRFYKNMYCNEGYLTFSLPVSNHHHLIAKLLANAIFSIISFVISLISISIAFSTVPEFWSGLSEFFKFIGIGLSKVNVFNLILYILEILIMIAVSVFSAPLIFYSCISIGQLGKKNRILLSIGVYYLYTIITQVISTCFMIFLGLIGIEGVIESIAIFAANNPYTFFHLMLISSIIIQVGFGTLFYYINYKIMTHKLNIE